MQDFETILAEHPLFRNLKSRYVEIIAGCTSGVSFETGEFIFREGEDSNEFYLIRKGRVALETHAPGHEPVTIQILGEGEVLGWSWLVPPYKKRFDARAIDPTRMFAIDGACLRGKCEKDPRMGYEMLKRFAGMIGDRLQATRLQLLDLYAMLQ